MVRSRERGAVVLGARGARFLDDDRVEGQDPLAPFGDNAAEHLRRTDRFAHVADVMIGSFYDATLDEGCAFEELISFHGGLGGPQTRAFVMFPSRLEAPAAPLVGAAAVHDQLWAWRRQLQDGASGSSSRRAPASPPAAAAPPRSSPAAST